MADQSEDPLHSVLSDLSRRFEPDRFVSALITAQPARAALLAIAAFGAELARISFEVSDPALAQIRLQWWRDALAEPGRGELAAHPVGSALRALLSEHDGTASDGKLAWLVDQTLQAAQDAAIAASGAGLSGAAKLAGNDGFVSPVGSAPLGTMAATGPSTQTGSALIQALAPVAKVEALLFQQSVSVLLPGNPQLSASSAVIEACALAGRAYGGARGAVLNAQYNQYNQSVITNSPRHDLIFAARRDALLAKTAFARLKCSLAPAFHPLALVEPYLRLAECTTPRIVHVLSASLPLRRMWRITQAHFGRRF